jgi:hypothetical protein
LLSQTGGAGGRGGAEIYYSSIASYCDDNARSGIYGGEYCEGYGAGYSGCCNRGGSPGDPYDNDDNVSSLIFLPGSGGGAGAGTSRVAGGAGGNGGAAILLYSTEMTLNGVVKANGGDGGTSPAAGGGGGSGGTVRIAACTVTTGLSASLQATGGRGGGSSGVGKMIFSVHLFTYSSSFSLSLSR